MIDTANEKLLRVPGEAAKSFPDRPHTSTIWRWHRRGIKGVRLETAIIGGRRYTSREAIQRFIERTTAADDGDTSVSASTPRVRSRAIDQAERELDAAGI